MRGQDAEGREPIWAWVLAPFATGSAFALAVAAYAVAHLAFRLAALPELGRDAVEDALSAQSWSWGYLPGNPPLHTWLLRGLWLASGDLVAAEAVLHFGLLAATYLWLHRAALAALGPGARAGVAAALPSVTLVLGWDALTVYTHGVAGTAAFAFYLWRLMRLVAAPTIGRAAIAGAALGVVALAKYPTAGLALGLTAGLLLVPDARRAITVPMRSALLLATAAAIGPHAAWHLLLAPSVESQAASPSALVALATALAGVLAPVLAVAALAWLAGPRLRAAWADGSATTALRVLAAGGATALAATVLAAAAVPMPSASAHHLVALPIVGAFLLGACLRGRGLAAVAAAILLCAATAFAIHAARGVGALLPCDPCYLQRPYAAAAAALRADMPSGGTLVAPDALTGGGVLAHLPGVRVAVPGYPVPPRRTGQGPGACVVVTRAEVTVGGKQARLRAVSQDFEAMAMRLAGVLAAASEDRREGRFPFHGGARGMLDLAWSVRPVAGDCR
ncbi:MAG: hypothetical protein JNK11_01920 [Alphaproteobacteria bacterium]|nr:hypothetical protein [Alphaproteobacteria bacterium]